MRFEGGECVVPPSLPEEEASSASKGIRDVFLQPVDHQTPSSAALPLSALFNSEAYDNYRKMTCVPSTSETAYESPSARPHTSTLTRDVPDLFEEPLAAVGVCTTLPSASIPLLSTTKYQSNSPSTSTLTDCRPNTRTTPRPSGGRPRRSTASSGSSTCSSVNSPTRSQTLAIQWNICGLRSHYNELQMLITKYQPVVVCLQETNLDYRKSCDGLLGTNYHLLLSQCSTHGRQGAGLAIKSGMPFKQIPLKTKIQAIAVQLFVPVNTTVVSVYLPPRDKEASKLFSELLQEIPKPALILGDLNGHHAAWGSKITAPAYEAKKKG